MLEHELQPKLHLARIECGLEAQRLRSIQAPETVEIIWPIQQIHRLATHLERVRVSGEGIVHRAEIGVIEKVRALHDKINFPPRLAIEVKRLGHEVSTLCHPLFEAIPAALRPRVDAEVTAALVRFRSGELLSVPARVVLATGKR